MEKVTITCPLTGVPFEAIKYADGRLIAANIFTGEQIYISYNASNDRYMINASAVKNTPVLTLDECAEFLGISKPRVSELVKKGRLAAIKPKARMFITRRSALLYAKDRKPKRKG